MTQKMVAPALRQVWRNACQSGLSPRLRSEAGWVLCNKMGEFGLAFVELKLLAAIMGPLVFAEYRLVLTALLLLGHALIMPMQQAYLRYSHTAHNEGMSQAADRIAKRWLTVVTLSVVVLAAVTSKPLSHWLGLHPWTLLAGGFVFLGNRWRTFTLQTLDFNRQRRIVAILNIGFLATALVTVVVVLRMSSVSASTALFSYASIAVVFGIIGLMYLPRHEAGSSVPGKSGLPNLIRQFGVPYAMLLIFQWVFTFSERYILGIQLDLNSVGIYIAAYMVCGFPFMMGLAFIKGFLLPIAYQRSSDTSDAGRFWSANVILLTGIAVYIVVGALTLPIYGLFGTRILELMTSSEYTLSTSTLVCLAVARYFQCLGPLLESIFAVHKRVTGFLRYRLLGGLVVIPLLWFAINWKGVDGAAQGILAANVVFIVAVTLGPGGCLGMIQTARRNASKATEPETRAV